MSRKTEADWDAIYQDVVPPFDNSYAVSKHAVTAEIINLEIKRVQVHYFGNCFNFL